MKSKTHVVTTSYISEAVRSLDGEAEAAGITVWNEVGGISSIIPFKLFVSSSPRLTSYVSGSGNESLLRH